MQSIKLNLIPGAVLPVVNVSQYDVKRTFALAVYDGAASYDLTGKTVTIRGTKPDNHGFDYGTSDGVISVSGNTVTVSTTQQMTAVGGQVMAELRIESGTTIIGTLNFIIDVEPSALSDETIISDTEIPVIERDFEAALAEAEADALVAEGYAKGTQDGTPVGSGSPYYHDNAKYYKEQAEEAASGVLEKYPKIVSDYWYVWDVETNQYVNTGVRAKGTQGDPGEGVPAGGTTGQVLRKKSDDNYDTEWANGGGGASALDDLTDVDITSPASGDGLLYDGAKWVNGAVATPDQIKGLGQTNAVNECPNDATSQVLNGVTFTVNPDGTVSLSGTASAAINYNIHLWANNTYNPTPYRRLTGCPSGGSTSTYFLRFIREGVFSRTDLGDGVLIDTTLLGGFFVRIVIASGTDCTGLVFKPMLSDARLNLRYEDYVPYAMSNRELTDGLKDATTYKIIATATASSSTTHADLFGILKTAYNNLTQDQKLRAEIWKGQNGSALIFKNFAANVGVFESMVSSGGSILYYTVRLDENDTSAYRKLTISTAGAVTNTDFGSEVCTLNLYLVVK